MSELKKIDYRNIDEKAPTEAPQATLVGEEKPSFFGSLANKWGPMNKKEKIGVLVLVVVVVCIIAVVIYYFSNTRPTFNPAESYAPPADEGWQAEQ